MPSIENGRPKYEVECECNDCLMTIKDVALLLSKANYSSEWAIN